MKPLEITLKEAMELVRTNDMFPYLKQTRRKHSSGYAMWEVGYCEVKGARVTRKHVLGAYCDHFWIMEYKGSLRGGLVDWDARDFSISSDLTLDGYMRFFQHHQPICWEHGYDGCFSSMSLTVLPPLPDETP